MEQAFRGVIAIAFILLVAFLFSANKKNINWRTVFFALAIQLSLGAFVLYIPFGKEALLNVSQGVNVILSHANEGINFMFGHVADKGKGFVFALHVLPVIVFFSSFIAVLYHIGIMGVVIKVIGGGLQKLLNTSRPESLCATANIFVGQTEAPLVVKPFINNMTQSELFAVMVCGLTSISGSIMSGYAGIGVELKYLIAASFMSAPAGLLMAKLVMPETEQTKDSLDELNEEDKTVNVIDAAAAGAVSGVSLAINVGAMLVAFIALISLVNGLLGGLGSLVGVENLTLQMILGYLFQPIAFILGVSWDEAHLAGSFIGQKIIANEFVAFLDFVSHKDQLSEHTNTIVTFALCGFANLSSIAILLGGLGSLAPKRRPDLVRLGVKALIAATLANLMSASIAGLFTGLNSI
ncbi:NupC/NupG family nucleoside CNT transporter [Agarilytica rhodophyticola]|uniref:NupC/NupG family nucleoside CNT transporter n=1 Tax=Agarilytica rhodophyticola TaxID=1737490 RepID=UPI000B347442|nr:NupC/NupG family nucleoside CNT transporter [Agarilytica rhodophyticola]